LDLQHQQMKEKRLMTKHKVGIVGVGQSPRVDILPGMKEILGKNVEVVEKGALDGLSLDAIRSLYPKEGMILLCTRLSDGTQVVIAKEEIIPRVQAKIEELNGEKVELIILLCTGHFPRFESRCLILEAQKVVDRCVEALICDQNTIGVLVPLPEQIETAKRSLSHITTHIVAVSASPYGPKNEILSAAKALKAENIDLVVMHCMGFTRDHKKILREVTGKPVLLANSIVARTVAELIQT
jgi:protein AroM